MWGFRRWRWSWAGSQSARRLIFAGSRWRPSGWRSALTAAERGALVRQIAARAHTHPDGSARRYSRGTIDRWLRAWRAGGLAALRPSPRADAGTVRAHPELFAEAAALRLELPGRSAAQISSILHHRHGTAAAGKDLVDDACAKKAVAELTRDY